MERLLKWAFDHQIRYNVHEIASLLGYFHLIYINSWAFTNLKILNNISSKQILQDMGTVYPSTVLIFYSPVDVVGHGH